LPYSWRYPRLDGADLHGDGRPASAVSESS
jgi:hypothetical protein